MSTPDTEIPVPPNELHPELLAAASLHPLPGMISAPRMQMYLSHIGQALVIADPTPRMLFTGIEAEYGRFTFSIKMPEDGQIIAVIDKFPLNPEKYMETPETVVIYQKESNQEIDVFTIPKYHTLHQHFGFEYVKKPEAIRKLYSGSNIAGGTVFADSPMVMPDGDYCYGREANVAYMSMPGVIEDGVIVSKSFARSMRTKGYETRTLSFGKKYFPLNLYGDEETYKICPDIGEYCREDGLLFGRREYRPILAPVQMSPAALRRPDYTYDDLVYTSIGRAKVVDVTVMRDGSPAISPTPVGMEPQPSYYHTRIKAFYREIIAVEQRMRRERKDDLKLSPRMHALVVEAMVAQEETAKQKIELLYKLRPLDDWRIDVTFEYEMEPTIASKVTGTHGNKGVICQVWEDEDMPVDDNGIRADIVMAGQAIYNRMIPAAVVEQYINATSQHLTRWVQQEIATHGKGKDVCDRLFTRLLRYYQIVSPPMFAEVSAPEMVTRTVEHIEGILTSSIGVRIWYPSDNPADPMQVIRQLKAEFPIPITPVTYKGRSGRIVRTKKPVLIGSSYMMLLEKIGNDFSGVGSAKLQVFGMPARLTNLDKYSAPVRTQPVRFTDESTNRLFVATIGGDATAELVEASNDPATHKHIVENLLRAEKPTNIDSIVDRSKVVRGRGRPQAFVMNVLQCQGIEFAYKPDSEQPPTVYYPEEK